MATKKGIVLYLDEIENVLDTYSQDIQDKEVGIIFYELIHYANGKRDYGDPDTISVLDKAYADYAGKGFSDGAKLLWATVKRMADGSEEAYQQRVRRNKEIVERTEDIRRLV